MTSVGKTVWVNERSATDADNEIVNIPARIFVEKWIQNRERIKEELEAGIMFITARSRGGK